MENFDFSKVKIAFFAAGAKISEKFAEKAAKHCLVIDNSSFYRMDPDVPLIVPQVNSNHLDQIKKNIIANPNCSTAQLVIALKPLHDLFVIKRIVVSTYQSVSGGGKAPMDELIEQTRLVLDNEQKKRVLKLGIKDIKKKYNIEDMYRASQYLIEEQCHPLLFELELDNPELLPID